MIRFTLLCLFIVLLSGGAVAAQSDSLQLSINLDNGRAPYTPSMATGWNGYPSGFSHPDTLVDKKQFRQVQTDNLLLKKQNDRLLNKSGGRWFTLIMLVVAGAVEAALR